MPVVSDTRRCQTLLRMCTYSLQPREQIITNKRMITGPCRSVSVVGGSNANKKRERPGASFFFVDSFDVGSQEEASTERVHSLTGGNLK